MSRVTEQDLVDKALSIARHRGYQDGVRRSMVRLMVWSGGLQTDSSEYELLKAILDESQAEFNEFVKTTGVESG